MAEGLTFDQAKELIDKAFDALVFVDPKEQIEENWNDALDTYRTELIREFRFGL